MPYKRIRSWTQIVFYFVHLITENFKATLQTPFIVFTERNALCYNFTDVEAQLMLLANQIG